MTPAQLRAYAAIVRLGSFKLAAEELGVTESAVSFHVAQLRRELGDPLVSRQSAGLAFTPGGLRLARRAHELLGLQDRTRAEVATAASGRRLLRLASSSLFGEYAAPGLLELFAARARDLDVELSVHQPESFVDLLRSRSADVAIGPRPPGLPPDVSAESFLRYEIVFVVAPDHPLAGRTVGANAVRHQHWFVGPSAAGDLGVVPALLHTLQVPEARQRIFQSQTAATEEVKRSPGIAPALSFAVGKELAAGSLARVLLPEVVRTSSWDLLRIRETTDGEPGNPTAELARFVTTPRAIQAMIKGTGVTSGRFRPSVHVTLWS